MVIATHLIAAIFVAATPVATKLALDDLAARLRDARHRRLTRRAGRLLQRVREDYEARGMTW